MSRDTRRPGGAPPPSVPLSPGRVIRPARTGGGGNSGGGNGRKGCPLLLAWPLALIALAVLVACGPRHQPTVHESPRPLQTARQPAP